MLKANLVGAAIYNLLKVDSTLLKPIIPLKAQ